MSTRTAQRSKVAAISSSSKRTGGFLSIAPEIRNEIYGWLLEAHCSTIVIKDISSGRSRLPQDSLRRFQCVLADSSQPRDRHIFNKNRGSGLHTAILRVNRQVYRESVSFLYGSNNFTFHNPYELRDGLLPLFGVRLRFVRHIAIEHGFVKGLRKCLTALRLARSLRTLELRGVAVTRLEMARELVPFLRILAERWRWEGDVVEILKLSRPWAGPHGGEKGPAGYAERKVIDDASLTEDVKAEVRRHWSLWCEKHEQYMSDASAKSTCEAGTDCYSRQETAGYGEEMDIDAAEVDFEHKEKGA